MKRNQGKGKALDISGIPLPGTITQVEGQTVETNREEGLSPFKHDTKENYGHDYFDDETERLGDLDKPFVANKDDRTWSDGIADEANEQTDEDDDEGLLPETQPLHVDLMTETGADDDANTVLRPDNVEDDSAV
jgi:hypothetical protein